MTPSSPEFQHSSIDPGEVARFSALAGQWWDPHGAFRPLHKFNPTRLAYIRHQLCTHFGHSPAGATPLNGLRLLDIGCGGGLVSEPMARMGARVVGADASEQNIGAAQAHASAQGLAIDYRHCTAEQLAQDGEKFDVVLNLEVIEHVTAPAPFVATCAALLRPGGMMVCATLNRTRKAWLLAVVGAEYILSWLPRGTHDWNKFITPDELAAYIEAAGLTRADTTGVSYQPLSGRWALGADTDINYMMCAVRPG